MPKRRFLLALALLFSAGIVAAQTSLQVHNAELSVPFGVVMGRLLAVGDHLAFIDDERPDTSFAVHRDDIENLTSEGDRLILESRRAVRDRSGERRRVSFRLREGSEVVALKNWFQQGSAQAAGSEAAGDAAALTYQVRHDHLFGGCQGRLLIAETTISYESVDKIDHSRQWDLKDIKEIKRASPYKLEIVPFTQNSYTLQLQRTGMDSTTYKALVDRIASQRASD